MVTEPLIAAGEVTGHPHFSTLVCQSVFEVHTSTVCNLISMLQPSVEIVSNEMSETMK